MYSSNLYNWGHLNLVRHCSKNAKIVKKFQLEVGTRNWLEKSGEKSNKHWEKLWKWYKSTLGGIALICFKSLQLQLRGIFAQGCQKIRIFLKSSEIPITRSTIQLKLYKTKTIKKCIKMCSGNEEWNKSLILNWSSCGKKIINYYLMILFLNFWCF